MSKQEDNNKSGGKREKKTFTRNNETGKGSNNQNNKPIGSSDNWKNIDKKGSGAGDRPKR